MVRLSLKSLFLVLLITCSLFIISSWRGNANEYDAAVIDKVKLLDQTLSPKIIFVGGSGLAFGLDSPRIQKELGRPVVNVGVNALVGLRFMLEQIKRGIGSGDVVVLIPEYTVYFTSVEGDGASLFNLVLHSPDQLQYMNSVVQYLEIVKASPSIYQARFAKLAAKLLGIADPGEASPTRGRFWKTYYRRNGFNSSGDLTTHIESGRVRDPALAGFFYAGMPDPAVDHLNLEVIPLLNSFASFVKSRNGKTFLMYPAFPDSVMRKCERIIRELDQHLNAESRIELLSDPQRYALPDSEFFDTIYHLNGHGRQLRTNLVIEDVKRKVPSIRDKS